jgi:hypothetical protein
MIRLLLDPAPAAAGGQPAPVPPNAEGAAAPNPPATPAGQPAPAPAVPQAEIRLTPAEYQQWVSDRAALAAQRQAEEERARTAEAARLKAVADKDGIQAALDLANRQASEERARLAQQLQGMQATLLNDRKVAAVAAALVGVGFVSPAAGRDAAEKLARGFEAAELNGQTVVRQVGTGRPLAEAVPELLKTDDYRHFLTPSTQGGAGAGRSDRGGADPQAEQAARRIGQIKAALDAQRGDAPGLAGTYGRPIAVN